MVSKADMPRSASSDAATLGAATAAKLCVLLISDGRPGHFHLSEGVVLALSRLRPVEVARLEVRRRRWLPPRLLRALIPRGLSPSTLLRLAHGLSAEAVPACDLVVSAGGNTLTANVAAQRIAQAPGIFIGSLRDVAPELFALVVSSFTRHEGLPRHLVTLKPNHADPAMLDRPAQVPRFGRDLTPGRIALLLGGDSGLFRYSVDDWRRLAAFVEAMAASHGSRFLISTSRRTPPEASAIFHELAGRAHIVERFLDYGRDGSGTLTELLAMSDVVVCTEDSSSMISEAVTARFPVVGVTPERCAFEEREAEYRERMRSAGWLRSVAIAELTPDRFLDALAEIVPAARFHVDRLAAELAERLPWLVASEVDDGADTADTGRADAT